MAAFSTSSPLWRRLRLVILERDGWECRIRAPGCTTKATEVDHIIPLSADGPPYDPANLRASCERCNRSRGGRTGAKRLRALREANEAVQYPPALEW